VASIGSIDLSAIWLKEISNQTKKLIFKDTLKLTPVMDEESNQLYVVDCPDIGLYAFAHTREELINEVNEQILMMWDEYATISPDKLAKDAKIIQRNLLEIITTETNAEK
jgi:hypothetical protein